MKIPDLPLTPRLRELRQLVAAHPVTILAAQPGAGKSTLVPPALLEGLTPGKKMIMLEPRRLAATACAQRIADILEEPLGSTVGYRVRGEARVGPHSRIEVITEGILTRMLVSDPGLTGVDLVIFDEFHERTLAADLGLALIRDLLDLREDLRVVIMSATLDLKLLQDQFPLAPVLEVPGRAFPVETRYRPLAPDRRWEAETARALAGLLEEEEGDVLVFLPGSGEIERLAREMEPLVTGDSELEIRRLSGQISLGDQRRVLSPALPGRRRIILTTSVAETSLTVPGIRLVVDLGLQRSSRQDLRTGLDQMFTDRVSRSSADQRRGRAGRVQAGVCLRLWNEREQLPESFPPEIRRADLSSLVLDCALWGARQPGDLRWIEAPDRDRWTKAQELLRTLEALDGEGRPTALGKVMADLGLPPRLAHLVLTGKKLGQGALACGCAALLETTQVLPSDTDFRRLLELLRNRRGEWVAGVEKEYRRLLDKLGLEYRGWTEAEEDSAGALVLEAYPEYLARKVSPGLFQLAGGRQMKLEGPLAHQDLVVALECDAGTQTGKIYRACSLTKEDVESRDRPLFHTLGSFQWEGWVLRYSRTRYYGRLEWSIPVTARPKGDELQSAVLDRVQTEGTSCLPWDGGARRLLKRLQLAGESCGVVPGAPSRWPDFSEKGLLDSLSLWLLPQVNDRGEALTPWILSQALTSLLDYGQSQWLDRWAPEKITVPSGSRRPVEYPEEGEPYLEVRIQEVFGLPDSPRVAGKPLVLHLLSPAGRPLQVTKDLGSFWKNTYPEVRKDMRGRYPRHYWPENPLEAEPTARAKPRGT